ncbi:hypothetical protein HYPSUDRAFT_44138, partial [Hypholoma sublateritium FD-334 SS-4]
HYGCVSFFVPAGAGSFCFRIAAPASIVLRFKNKSRMSRPPHVLQGHTHGPLPNLIHAEGSSLLHEDLCCCSTINGTWGAPYCGDLCHCLVKDCALTEGFRELQLCSSGCGRGDQCTPPIHTLRNLVPSAHGVSTRW